MGDSMVTWPSESRAAVVQELLNWQAFVGGDDRAGRREVRRGSGCTAD